MTHGFDYYIKVAGLFLAVAVPLVVYISKEKAANKAKFVATFLITLEKINRLVPEEYEDLFDLLQTEYPTHEVAFIEYSNNLSFVGKFLLRKKWLAYRGEYPIPPQIPEEDEKYRFAHFIPSSNSEAFVKKEQVVKSIKKLIA